jgi:predicted nicotinamide N-methyase
MEEAWAGLQAELDDASLPAAVLGVRLARRAGRRRYVLDTPARSPGRRVLDLATGLRAVRPGPPPAPGAARVEGVDVDPVAVVAAGS